MTRVEEGYLRLTIRLQMADDGHPLLEEQADCADIFDVIHELNFVTGVRFRDRLGDAALINLRRRNPPADPPGTVVVIQPEAPQQGKRS